MNRRELIRTTGAAGLAAWTITEGTKAATSAAEPEPAPATAPAVYGPRPDGATVIWPVGEPSLGWVELGEEGASGPPAFHCADGYGFIAHGDHVIRVRLEGLDCRKRYWYRTHTRPVGQAASPGSTGVRSSETYRLTLPNPDAATTSFFVWNDTHDHPETLTRLAELTQSQPADFLLWNGDVTNNINREAMISGLFLQPRGGVDLAKGAPIFLNRGNHDVRGAQANRLPGYVAYPDGQAYYSFRCGPVGAIVLDTGEDKPDDHPSFLGLVDFARFIDEQARWLDAEITKPHLKDAPYRLIFCHIPLRWTDETPPDYANGGYDYFSRRGRDAWQNAIVRWGAQLVISGHTHQARLLPATEAFPYPQITGGGPKLDSNARLIQVHADPSRLSLRVLHATTGQDDFTIDLKPANA